MKKTVEVEIANQDFTLKSDAYDLLENYLSKLEHLFSSLPEKTEILEDIESRIAEKLLKKTKTSKVVTAGQVVETLEKIGSPEEIYEVLNEFDYNQKRTIKARLFRDVDNAVLGGVCSGIGAYFNVDPIIVRLIFVLFTLIWGVGLLIYLVLYLVLPEAKTPEQKMQMRGGGNILNKIDKEIQKLANQLKIPEVRKKFEEKVMRKEAKKTRRKTDQK